MNYRSVLLVLLLVLALPFRAPAPLIYRPGEGWTYEPVGGEGKWQRPRAKEQLDVAQQAFDKKDYNLALKAARRVVRVWPLSDYAPQAQYLLGRCYEAKGRYETAFAEYQKVLDKQPKIGNYQEIVERQYGIANGFLAGRCYRLWGVIPYPSKEKTAEMYDKIVKNGPYSDIGPQAQMKLGETREKQKNFALAAKAYEAAADRYHDRPQIAADALYRQALAYNKEAQTAEYDQSTAGQAISTFQDFMALYPGDQRATEAQKKISALKAEQARGSFQIAKFYEKYRKWGGAVVYYNEVLLLDSSSPYANEARQRIALLKDRAQKSAKD